jgi:hypothetical protein
LILIFFIKIDKHFFKILSLNSGNMNQENMFLLQNGQYIKFIYVLYFHRFMSNMHPRYGNSFLL